MRRVLLPAAALAAVLSILALLPRRADKPGSGSRAPVPEGVSASPQSPVTVSDLERLKQRGLAPPVDGMDPRRLRDSFGEARVGHGHEALDIPAPRGTRVLAVDDGTVVRLFNSVRGGLTVYHFDPTGSFCYYYAHLDAYAAGLAEGATVRKGDTLGYVGTTGNAPPNTPHLHFTIFKLGPEKHWWQGTPVNPFPLWALGAQALP